MHATRRLFTSQKAMYVRHDLVAIFYSLARLLETKNKMKMNLTQNIMYFYQDNVPDVTGDSTFIVVAMFAIVNLLLLARSYQHTNINVPEVEATRNLLVQTIDRHITTGTPLLAETAQNISSAEPFGDLYDLVFSFFCQVPHLQLSPQDIQELEEICITLLEYFPY